MHHAIKFVSFLNFCHRKSTRAPWIPWYRRWISRLTKRGASFTESTPRSARSLCRSRFTPWLGYRLGAAKPGSITGSHLLLHLTISGAMEDRWSRNRTCSPNILMYWLKWKWNPQMFRWSCTAATCQSSQWSTRTCARGTCGACTTNCERSFTFSSLLSVKIEGFGHGLDRFSVKMEGFAHCSSKVLPKKVLSDRCARCACASTSIVPSAGCGRATAARTGRRSLSKRDFPLAALSMILWQGIVQNRNYALHSLHSRFAFVHRSWRGWPVLKISRKKKEMDKSKKKEGWPVLRGKFQE